MNISADLLKVIKNNGVLGIQYLATAFTAVVLTPLLIKCVGISNYGQIILTLSISGYFGIWINFSTPYVGVKNIAMQQDLLAHKNLIANITNLKLNNYLLSIPMMGLIACISGIKPVSGFTVFAICGLASSFNMNWVLQGRGRFKTLAVVSIFATLLTLAIGYNVNNLPRFIDAYSWTLIIVTIPQILSALILYSIAYKTYGLKIEVFIKSKYTREYFKEIKAGLPFLFSQVASTLYTSGGVLFVFYVAGVYESGVFAGLDRFTNAAMGGLTLIGVASYPILAKLINEDKKQYKKLFLEIMAFYQLIALLLAIILLSCSSHIVLYLFGNKINEGIQVLVGACIWLQFGILGPLLTNHLTLTGQSMRIFKINLSVMILSFSLATLSVAYLGGLGWYLAISIAQIVLCRELIRQYKEYYLGEVL